MTIMFCKAHIRVDFWDFLDYSSCKNILVCNIVSHCLIWTHFSSCCLKLLISQINSLGLENLLSDINSLG